MSFREFNLWERYRFKYGPLNPVRRYDQGFALVATQINRSHGGKAIPLDFMPYGKQKQPDVDLDANTFIAALGKGVKIGR